jgi:aryl carrier-like protein
MMLRKNHAQVELIDLAKRGVVGKWETAYQIQALWVAQFELTRSYC